MSQDSESSLRIKVDAAGIDLSPPFVGVRIDVDGEIRARAPRDLRIDLDSDPPRLVWRFYGGWKEGPRIRGCLNAFLKVAHDPTPERILSFAENYGVLGICEHDIPWTHQSCELRLAPVTDVDIASSEINRPPDVRRGGPPPMPDNARVFDQEVEAWEELDKFQFYAKWARDLLMLSSDLMAGETIKQENWQRIQLYRVYRHGAEHSMTPMKDEREWQTKLVTDGLSDWLSMANVRPSCLWNYENAGGNSDPKSPLLPPQIRLSLIEEPAAGSIAQMSFTPPPPALFRVLALQLVSAVASARGVYTCAYCQAKFVPDYRKRASRRRTYCPDHDYKRKTDWWRRTRPRRTKADKKEVKVEKPVD